MTSLPFAQDAADRGAGGKLRKPSSRKPPATPYTRPQQQSRWLSKLVDPAYRLISGGASLILPSLFSSYKSPRHVLPAPGDQQQEEEEDHEILNTEEECAEAGAGSNHGKFRSTDVAGPSSMAGGSKNVSDFYECKQDKREETTDNDGLSEIEQLLKGKNFSRDEIHRLIEIIHSRAVDLPEQENKYPSIEVKGDAERPTVAHENPRNLTVEKEEDLCKAPCGTSTAPLQSFLAPCGTSITPLQSSLGRMQDKVGASPIDIAKAYMGTRTSEVGLGSKSLLAKDERTSPNGAEFALKPYIPSPLHKPSTCWPGAMLQDQRGYLTPQSERGYGLHNFPRTPYSRTIFSKSKLTQVEGDGNRDRNASTPLQQSQTPIYEQSRRIVLDNGHGSVGPFRRSRHKVAADSPARGSVNFHSSANGLSPVGNSKFFEGFPVVKKNLELGGTSGSSIFQSVDKKIPISEVGVPPVHSHSSQMARTILEHLDRNPPTPKDKYAELKLATSRKKPESSNVTTSMPSKQNNILNLGGLGSSKKADEGDRKNSAQVNEARLNHFFKVTSQENTEALKDSLNETTSTSEKKFDHIFTISQGGSAGPSHDLRKTQDFEIKSKQENDSKILPNAADGEVLNFQRRPPSHSAGTKTVLPAISVVKPGQRWTFGSDNSKGFSFPVSASTGVSSEPPTPSIMPSMPASDVHQPKEGSAVPSYSFGLNRSTSLLVFAFPSTSSTPTNDDAPDIKFNFGSDKTTRISFSSIGKDAICY